MPPASLSLPEWLLPMEEAARTIRGEDLSAFVPPADAHPTEGAVLVLFGDGPGGPDLLLTERAHTMRSQPGQVSFPGGRCDYGEDAVETALREAEEETGLDPEGIEVFGVLPRLWLPPRNFAVTPVLAYWDHPSPIHVVNEREVHAVFRTPIADLVDPVRRFSVKHPLGWAGPGWMVGPDDDVLLWGFTAGIINALLDYVGWAGPWNTDDVRSLPQDMADLRRIAEFLGVETLGEVQRLIAEGANLSDLVDREHSQAPEVAPETESDPGPEAGSR